MGIIDDRLQQLAVDVETQLVTLAHRHQMIALPLPDGRGKKHPLRIGECFQGTAIHTSKDGIVAIGTDSEVVEVI